MHYAFSAAPSVLIYILTGIPALRPGLATGGPSGLLLVSISSFEAGSEVPGYSRFVPLAGRNWGDRVVPAFYTPRIPRAL